ncbi:hypothetical protein ACFLU1_02635 [Chloroflexota bacterium]
MECPKCGSNNLDKIENDIEDQENYGCRDCDCWFTVHSEPYTVLVKELEYE